MAPDLQSHFLAMIATDTRPVAQRDQFQAGAGRKRTTIRDAHVIPLAGATLPVKQLVLDKLANAGITVRGVLKQGPLVRSAIHQGALSDCYMLATLLCLCLIAPTWVDDYVILPVTLADGSPGCVVFYYEQKSKSIVAITTSLEVSTSYNNPSDASIQPELLEKTFGFFRSGIQDYFQINMGNTDFAYAIGLRSAAARQPSQLPSAFINLHRAANRGILIMTAAAAKILAALHAYSALSGTILLNPWFGDQDVAVLESTLQNGAEVAAMYALEPAGILPKLAAPVTPLPLPEKPMPPTITIIPTDTTARDAYSGVTVACRISGAVKAELSLTGKADATPIGVSGGYYPFQLNEAGATVNPRTATITAYAADGSHSEASVVFKIADAPIPPVTPDTKPTPAKVPQFVLYEDGTWGKA